MNTMEDDIYSDVDSEEFLEDMKGYGLGQAFPLDVRTPRFPCARLHIVCITKPHIHIPLNRATSTLFRADA
jgi:hypothetical protein